MEWKMKRRAKGTAGRRRRKACERIRKKMNADKRKEESLESI